MVYLTGDTHGDIDRFKHGRLRWLGGLTERHLGYGSEFMDEEKDTRARAFAAEMIEELQP